MTMTHLFIDLTIAILEKYYSLQHRVLMRVVFLNHDAYKYIYFKTGVTLP